MSMSVNFEIDEPLVGTAINFISPDEQEYPQLTRLYLDFNFRVLVLSSTPERTGNNHPSKQYLLAAQTRQSLTGTAISPKFTSLNELERYADDNIIDILNDQLDEVGFDELNYHQSIF